MDRENTWTAINWNRTSWNKINATLLWWWNKLSATLFSHWKNLFLVDNMNNVELKGKSLPKHFIFNNIIYIYHVQFNNAFSVEHVCPKTSPELRRHFLLKFRSTRWTPKTIVMRRGPCHSTYRGEITPGKPIYFRPFIGSYKFSYNDRRGPTLLLQKHLLTFGFFQFFKWHLVGIRTPHWSKDQYTIPHSRKVPTENSLSKLSHSIHVWIVWYIYLHLPSKSAIHAGTCTSPMEGMGMEMLFKTNFSVGNRRVALKDHR